MDIVQTTLSFTFVVASTLSFVVAQCLFHWYLDYREHSQKLNRGLSWAPVFVKWNNRIFGLVSFAFFIVGLYVSIVTEHRFASWETLVCTDPDHSSSAFEVDQVLVSISHFPSLQASFIPFRSFSSFNFLFYLFYLSKLWESLDVLGVMGLGAPIAVQFRFHHLTTLLCCWFALVGQLPSIVPSLLLNSFHHSLMYPHFGQMWNVTGVLMVTGTLQLLFALGSAFFALYRRYIVASPCFGSPVSELVCVVLYIGYFILWVHDLIVARRERIAQKSAKTS
jgi:hypothetical protein